MTSQADREELQELRRIRDRSKVLEGENSALQRRVKDYETKVANQDKLAQTSRQSLVQARQRAEEWERRAKEAEGQLEVAQTKLDEVEQAHSQLDADYSLVKLQLEERDAEERLDKVSACRSASPQQHVSYRCSCRIGKTSYATKLLLWKARSHVCRQRSRSPRSPRPSSNRWLATRTATAKRTIRRPGQTRARVQCIIRVARVRQKRSTTARRTTCASRRPHSHPYVTRSMRPGGNPARYPQCRRGCGRTHTSAFHLRLPATSRPRLRWAMTAGGNKRNDSRD